ncbi:N-6 DNA methylase [Roseobacter ponti]|uniref:SAM-dependent DNA methyltransferase n=1 Tax=Roseobacter ponti TaxID=1891787 RepID=A0A858SQR8_9RHOB|nr:SAM-dependent DNA methyltransferase [Roseobacter ponti]
MDGTDRDFIAQTSRARSRKPGQFLTPGPIAGLMAECIALHNPASVCDPAVGTCILLRPVLPWRRAGWTLSCIKARFRRRTPARWMP